MPAGRVVIEIGPDVGGSSVRWTSDGTLLAIAEYNSARLVDPRSGDVVWTSNEGYDYAFDRDGLRVAYRSLSTDELHVREVLADRVTKAAMPKGHNKITFVGERIVTWNGYAGLEDRAVSLDVFSASDLSSRRQLRTHFKYGEEVVVHHGGNAVFVNDGFIDGPDIVGFDLRSGQRIVESDDRYNLLALSNSGSTFIAGSSPPELVDVRSRRAARPLTGLSEYPRAAAFGPDDSIVAIGTVTGAVEIRDVASTVLDQRLQLRDDEQAVSSISFSPDGAFLACAYPDDKVFVWGPVPGRELRLRSHRDGITCVIPSEDGVIATGSRDGTVRFWDLRTSALLRTLRGPDGPINDIAYDATKKQLAAASLDRSVCLWDVETGRLLRRFPADSPVFAVALRSAGERVVAGCRNGEVIVWDRVSGERESVLKPGGAKPVLGIAMSPDGDVGIASMAGQFLWPMDGEPYEVHPDSTPQSATTASSDPRPSHSVAFDPRGIRVAFGTIDGAVSLCLRRDTWAEPMLGRSLEVHDGAVRSIHFRPDGRLFATSGDDGVIAVHYERSGVVRRMTGHTGAARGVAFASDGVTLVSGGVEPFARIWDSYGGREAGVLGANPGGVGGITRLARRGVFAAGFEDGTLRLWREEGEVVQRSRHDAPITGIATYPGGDTVATVAANGEVVIGGIQAPYEATLLGRHVAGSGAEQRSRALAAAFHPDGYWLATGGADDLVRIWTQKSSTTKSLAGHAGWVRCVAVHPNGKWLASGSDDGSVRVWDTGDWTTAHTLRHPDNPDDAVWSIAFDETGEVLFVGTRGGRVHRWGFADQTIEGTSFEGHRPITAMTLIPEPARLVVGFEDGTVTLLEAGRALSEVRSLTGHRAGVTGLVYADGRVMSASASGIIRSIPLAGGDAAAWIAMTGGQWATLRRGKDGLVARRWTRGQALEVWGDSDAWGPWLPSGPQGKLSDLRIEVDSQQRIRVENTGEHPVCWVGATVDRLPEGIFVRAGPVIPRLNAGSRGELVASASVEPRSGRADTQKLPLTLTAAGTKRSTDKELALDTAFPGAFLRRMTLVPKVRAARPSELKGGVGTPSDLFIELATTTGRALSSAGVQIQLFVDGDSVWLSEQQSFSDVASDKPAVRSIPLPVEIQELLATSQQNVAARVSILGDWPTLRWEQRIGGVGTLLPFALSSFLVDRDSKALSLSIRNAGNANSGLPVDVGIDFYDRGVFLGATDATLGAIDAGNSSTASNLVLPEEVRKRFTDPEAKLTARIFVTGRMHPTVVEIPIDTRAPELRVDNVRVIESDNGEYLVALDLEADREIRGGMLGVSILGPTATFPLSLVPGGARTFSSPLPKSAVDLFAEQPSVPLKLEVRGPFPAWQSSEPLVIGRKPKIQLERFRLLPNAAGEPGRIDVQVTGTGIGIEGLVYMAVRVGGEVQAAAPLSKPLADPATPSNSSTYRFDVELISELRAAIGADAQSVELDFLGPFMPLRESVRIGTVQDVRVADLYVAQVSKQELAVVVELENLGDSETGEVFVDIGNPWGESVLLDEIVVSIPAKSRTAPLRFQFPRPATEFDAKAVVELSGRFRPVRLSEVTIATGPSTFRVDRVAWVRDDDGLDSLHVTVSGIEDTKCQLFGEMVDPGRASRLLNLPFEQLERVSQDAATAVFRLPEDVLSRAADSVTKLSAIIRAQGEFYPRTQRITLKRHTPEFDVEDFKVRSEDGKVTEVELRLIRGRVVGAAPWIKFRKSGDDVAEWRRMTARPAGVFVGRIDDRVRRALERSTLEVVVGVRGSFPPWSTVRPIIDRAPALRLESFAVLGDEESKKASEIEVRLSRQENESPIGADGFVLRIEYLLGQRSLGSGTVDREFPKPGELEVVRFGLPPAVVTKLELDESIGVALKLSRPSWPAKSWSLLDERIAVATFRGQAVPTDDGNGIIANLSLETGTAPSSVLVAARFPAAAETGAGWTEWTDPVRLARVRTEELARSYTPASFLLPDHIRSKLASGDEVSIQMWVSGAMPPVEFVTVTIAPAGMSTGLIATLVTVGLLLVLVVGFVLYPSAANAQRLRRDPSQLLAEPASELRKVNFTLGLWGARRDVLKRLDVPSERWANAVAAWPNPAAALAASLQAELGDARTLTDGMELRRLKFGKLPIEVAETLGLLSTGTVLPQNWKAGLQAALVEEGLQGRYILLIAAVESKDVVAEFKDADLRIVPVDEPDLTRLMVASNSIDVLCGLISRHATLAEISPFKIGGGVDRSELFFGRQRELALLRARGPRNALLVGARQMGKSSILRALERSDRDHYRSLMLTGADFMANWRREGLPEWSELKRHENPDDVPVFLIDEVDKFILADAENRYRICEEMRALAEQNRARFVLAGFWTLHRTVHFDNSAPLRNFGEPIEIGPLDPAAAADLARKPMQLVGVEYESDEVVEHICERTGGRANLIAVACRAALRQLDILGRREITMDMIRDVLDPSTEAGRDLARQNLHINQLTTYERGAALDNLVMYATVERGRFTKSDLLDELNSVDVYPDPRELTECLERLSLAYVIRMDGGEYDYPIPLVRDDLMIRTDDDPLRALKDSADYWHREFGSP